MMPWLCTLKLLRASAQRRSALRMELKHSARAQGIWRCHLHRKDYSNVVRFCDKVLDVSPSHVKCSLRKGLHSSKWASSRMRWISFVAC